jgi:hypothetical protein
LDTAQHTSFLTGSRKDNSDRRVRSFHIQTSAVGQMQHLTTSQYFEINSGKVSIHDRLNWLKVELKVVNRSLIHSRIVDEHDSYSLR